ncbi:MepB family protein, partial [Enterococcus faecalis]
MNSLPILEKAVGAITLLSEEKQNAEYEGFLCQVNESQQLIRSRLAKKTPKKEGYFAAFWEKNQQNQNEAFDATEAPEMLAIVIADQEKQGLFLLPKECLIQQKILKTNQQKGKMAAR